MTTAMTMNKDYLEEIEKELYDLLSSRKDLYPTTLYEAMEYALFPAGKRIRPYLSYLTADFVGVNKFKIKPLALSVELIHNYSLIHDDMPCMDNDEYRRGKFTCHKKFGEATALLAGDALLNLAFENLLVAVGNDPDLATSATIIAECAGGSGMIGGQAIELTNEYFDEALVTELCKKKTGALINAAVMSVAVLSGERKKISSLGTYAGCVGLCYQLVDDLLDEDKEEKKSFLGVMGKEETIVRIDRLTELLHRTMSPYGKEGQELLRFGQYLSERKK